MRRKPFIVLGLLLTGILPSPARAELTAEDARELTRELALFDQSKGQDDWPKDPKLDPPAILSKPQYAAKDWEAFFSAYFETHAYSNGLASYLGYPVVSWLDRGARSRIQQGLLAPLLTKSVREGEPFESLANARGLFVQILQKEDVPRTEREKACDSLLTGLLSQVEREGRDAKHLSTLAKDDPDAFERLV